MTTVTCYHCGLPTSPNAQLSVELNGETRPMCCHGCVAVAQAIKDAKLEKFYIHRTKNSFQGKSLIPQELQKLSIYDHPQVQKSFVKHDEANIRHASFLLEGISCAACLWLNQQHLSSLHGIQQAQVNYSKQMAFIRWDETQIKLSEILASIRHIGYKATPYDPSKRQLATDKTGKTLLKQIGIAGIFGMQVMILAVSLYFNVLQDMQDNFVALFKKASLLLTLPVLGYSAQAFFIPAWRALKNQQLSMDVPISLALLIAFCASVLAVFNGKGEIYFDTICMFTFLLLGARYLEVRIHQNAARAADLVGHNPPTSAYKINASGKRETVAAIDLTPGDTVVVPVGDIIPADSTIIKGSTTVDESILTGESQALKRQHGDQVIGGSLNLTQPITITIKQPSDQGVLGSIQQMLDKAQSQRPSQMTFIDKIAGKFILAVLLIASSVAIYRFFTSPADWLETTISVLIVACPCALSLATPATITAATGKLMQMGVMLINPQALEILCDSRYIIFDKTGTLTNGDLQVIHTKLIGNDDIKSCMKIAACLEQSSTHPVAHAFSSFPDIEPCTITHADNNTGIQGKINQQIYFIGSVAYVHQQTGIDIESLLDDNLKTLTIVVLANQDQILCLFGLGDDLKTDAHQLISWLQKNDYIIRLLSGDRLQAVNKIAKALGIKDALAEQTPQQKLAQINAYQKQAERIIMIGDGVNDAATLAGADVSFAVFNATPIANANADILLMNPKLNKIKHTIKTAQKTQRIIKQNIAWSLGYNFLSIPLAATGYITPWLAAIGMSLSSLLVILNAQRIRNN